MPKLSVIVITQDEAANIEAALDSVTWADELIVVDSGSSDETARLAERFTKHVSTRNWEGYGAQKNYAASLASHDWILSLDADERIPPELAEEIQELLKTEPVNHGYRIPRVAFHLGRWIRSTDWYPDYQLRLYTRRLASWNERRVHESVQVQGTTGTLRNEIHHLAYRDLSHHFMTMDRYTTLAAEEMSSQGQRGSLWKMVVHPPFAFIRNYLVRGGIRDGIPGFIVSVMNTYYVLLKFIKLWEFQHKRTSGNDN